MNGKFLNALELKQQACPPIWLMRQAGRYMPSYREVRRKAGSFMQLCKSPELATEVTLQPIDQFDLDAAIIFSDILTIPDAMDVGLEFHEGKGPIIHKPIRSLSDVRTRTNFEVGNVNYVFDAIKMTKRALNNRVPLIGFSGSPWTLACYMVEGSLSKTLQTIKGLSHTDPEMIQSLLQILETAVIEYCQKQVLAGADTIMIFDSWGGMLPYHDYLKLSYANIARIVEAINAPVVVFSKPCSPWLHQLAELKCQGIGIDYTTDLDYAKKVLGGKKAIQGNLDPNLLLGSKELLSKAITRNLTCMQDTPGFIFNLGHGIVKETNPDMVKYLVEIVREKCL
jgi:uroporphyrinogen decarboxylase